MLGGFNLCKGPRFSVPLSAHPQNGNKHVAPTFLPRVSLRGGHAHGADVRSAPRSAATSLAGDNILAFFFPLSFLSLTSLMIFYRSTIKYGLVLALKHTINFQKQGKKEMGEALGKGSPAFRLYEP